MIVPLRSRPLLYPRWCLRVFIGFTEFLVQDLKIKNEAQNKGPVTRRMECLRQV